jgi:hypothetical protein
MGREWWQKNATMKMLRHSLVLWLIGSSTVSSFATENLSEILVGTWLGITRTENTYETTFNADGSYVGVSDLRSTADRKWVEAGKWRLEGDQLFLRPDLHPESEKHPYAKVIFDPAIPLTALSDESRNSDGAVLLLEETSDSWKWANGDLKAVHTGYYQKQSPEDFVCAEEVALMQQEANAVAKAAQRSARSLNIAPTLLPLAATINNPPADRLNTANRADVESQNTQTVQPPMQHTMNSENIVYTVVAEGQLLKCIDTSSGMVVGSINFAGTLIQGPTVTGNRCTVVTDSYLGKKGTVYEIPMFSVVTSFDVMP